MGTIKEVAHFFEISFYLLISICLSCSLSLQKFDEDNQKINSLIQNGLPSTSFKNFNFNCLVLFQMEITST